MLHLVLIDVLDRCFTMPKNLNRIEITIYSAVSNSRNSRRAHKSKEADDIAELVDQIAGEIKEPNVRLVVKILQRGYSHKSFGTLSPPILLINDEVVSQGIVPDKNYLKGLLLHEIWGKSGLRMLPRPASGPSNKNKFTLSR